MRTRIAAFALAIAALAGAGAALAQGAAGGDVIAERRAGLKRMGEHMQALKAVVDSRGDPRGQVGRVDEMIAFYTTLPARFPAGSGTGDTRALPSIWSDNAGFVQANTNALTALRTLRDAAANGDAGAYARAFEAAGGACGGCHRPYRAPAR